MLGHGDPKYGIVSIFFDLWSPVVRVGDKVSQGQVISALATPAEASGESGGHVHWEIRYGAKTTYNPPYFSFATRGTDVNPVSYVK